MDRMFKRTAFIQIETFCKIINILLSFLIGLMLSCWVKVKTKSYLPKLMNGSILVFFAFQ